MRAWSTGFDGTWKLNGASSSGSASATHKTAGGAAGLDYQLDPDLLVGFAIGGSTSNFSVADLATGGEIAGTHLGVYGVKRLQSFYVDAALSFSTFGNTTSRSITGVDTPEVARGQFNSNLLSARLELGWKQRFKRFSVTPFAAIQLAELWQSGYAETTGIVPGVAGFGLSYAPVNVRSLPTFLGVEAAARSALPNGMIVSPYGRISWVHEFYPTREVTAFLTALPSASFIVDGPSVTRDAVKLDIGSRVALNQNAMLFGNFVGQFSDRSQMYSGKGGFRLAW
jgi:outer membrane autotransporter protein